MVHMRDGKEEAFKSYERGFPVGDVDVRSPRHDPCAADRGGTAGLVDHRSSEAT